MLLFGNKLSAAADNNDMKVLSTDMQKGMLKALSNQEKLLLVELQRTRKQIVDELDKLQVKSGSNEEDLVKQTIRNYEEEDLSPTRGTSAASVLKKTGDKKVNKVGIEMLPVLASSGEGAFEVGINRGRGPRLPIFKLPALHIEPVVKAKHSANDSSLIINVAKKHEFVPYHTILSFLENAYRLSVSLPASERAFICSHLGMTDADLAKVERHLKLKYSSERANLEIKVCSIFLCILNDSCHKENLMDSTSASSTSMSMNQLPLSQNTLASSMSSQLLLSSSSASLPAASPKRSLAKSSSNLRPMSMSMSRSRSTSTAVPARRTSRGNNNVGDSLINSSAAMLKVDLLRSLRNMQQHTAMVKEGIVDMQNFLNVKYPRARDLVISMAAERFFYALEKVVCKVFRQGWNAWLLAVELIKLDEKVDAYLTFLGRRHLILGLSKLMFSVLKKKFVIWQEFNYRESRRIRQAREFEAVITIQRVIRGYLGRKKANSEKEVHKYQKMYDSTIRLQAFFRMKIARWRYLKAMNEVKQDSAARLIQRVYRGHVARKLFRSLQLQKKRYWAAVKIQCAARQRAARKVLYAKRERRRQYIAAAKVQSIVRGFLVRVLARQKGDHIRRHYAAIRIQAIIRGKIVRKYLTRRRKEQLEHRGRRNNAATKIQSTYRGYRAYLHSRILLLEVQRKMRIKSAAATKICNMVRGFLSRAARRKLEKARFLSWLQSARTWQEMWSTDSNTWFYYNSQTGDALWEPPREGYTKSDGKLVLMSGEIIDDPKSKKLNIFGEEEEEEDQKGSTNFCSECNQRFAIKACKECDDKFCTICYKATHSTGTRRTHKVVATGLLDCSECEALLAERWCVACDEGFCDGCWRKVHTRGNRRFHPFREVNPEGRIDGRIFTMDGEQVGDYDSSFALQRQQKGADMSETGASQQSNEGLAADYSDDAANWTEYFDDDGVQYWYNASTGASQYENPLF